MEYLVKLFLLLLLNHCHQSLAGKHPHGSDEVLVKINRAQEFAKFEANNTLTEKLFLHPQVADRKIVIFSIIGAYREGKSFFLDYCLRYLYATYGSINTIETKTVDEDWMGDPNANLTGFSWKHGSTAHTKGLMIWSDVFLFDTPNGERLAIFIVDTQGLFEVLSTTEENSKIFSFSTLVSSIQIININQKIQENQIGHLQTALELTTLIESKQKKRQAGSKKAFQSLIFLLRDFEDEEYGYGFEGGQRYFNKFFGNDYSQNTTASVNRNNIRESFDKISCFLLGHPGKKIRKSNFNGQWGMLESDFTQNLKVVIESLLSPDNLVKKSVLGTEITSRQFRDYFLALTKSYSDYQTPEINNLFQVAVDNQMSAIIKEKFEEYKKQFKEQPINYEQQNFIEWFEEMHQGLKNITVDQFLSADKIDDKPSEEKFKKLLEDDIEAHFSSVKGPIIEAYWLYVDNQLSKLVKKHFESYRSAFKVNESDYKQKDFPKWLQERHQRIENETLEAFVNEAGTIGNATSIQKHKPDLESDIQKSFNSSNNSILDAYWNAVDSQLKTLVEKHRKMFMNLSEVQDKDFKQKDFPMWVQRKYEENKNKTVEEFLKADKIGDKSNEEKHKNKLVEDIENDFASTIKESIMYKYGTAVDKNLKELEDKFCGSYKNLTDVQYDDYYQDYFSQWLEDKHVKVKKEAVDGFLRADKIGTKENEDKTKILLEACITQYFESTKNTTIQTFNSVVEKDLPPIVDNHLNIYVNSFKVQRDDDYFQRDFAAWLEEEHKRIRIKTTDQFLKFKKIGGKSNEQKYKANLELKVENHFLSAKTSIFKAFNAAVENELPPIVDKYLSTYVSSFKVQRYYDYYQWDFAGWLENEHSRVKGIEVNKFLNTRKIGGIANEQRYKTILQQKIDSNFDSAKPSILAIYNTAVNNELKSLVITYVIYYKADMSYEGNFYDRKDYFEQLQMSHNRVKSSKVDEFSSHYKIGGNVNNERYKEILRNDIDISFRSINASRSEIFNQKRIEFKRNLEEKINRKSCP